MDDKQLGLDFFELPDTRRPVFEAPSNDWSLNRPTHSFAGAFLYIFKDASDPKFDGLHIDQQPIM